MNDILEILEKNAKATCEQISVMAGIAVEDVEKQIKEFERDGIILGYNATIDWEKTDKEAVQALIEVKVTPQRSEGFDKVAERIFRFPEVKDCYLMSGGFDLTVIVEGLTMKEVALFVAEKLAPIDSVVGTATHFVLKKYKDKGIIFGKRMQSDREAIYL